MWDSPPLEESQKRKKSKENMPENDASFKE
jgi:hypothetical protein